MADSPHAGTASSAPSSQTLSQIIEPPLDEIFKEINSDAESDYDETEKISYPSSSASKESSPDVVQVRSEMSDNEDTEPLICEAASIQSQTESLIGATAAIPSRPESLRIGSTKQRVASSEDALESLLVAPLGIRGVMSKEGDMTSFVAEGIEELIKLSSPLSQSQGSSSIQSPTGSSTWSESTSSASEWSRDYSHMSRSPSILTTSPDDIPNIDPRSLLDLEVHAQKVAISLETMMDKLQNNLRKISALTFHNVDAYKDGVLNTCDTVDTSIKSMYALMAKCEELSQAMKPVYQLHTQVEEIKRLLSLMEKEMQS